MASQFDAATLERARNHPVPGQFFNPRTGMWQPIDQPPPFSSSTTGGVVCIVLLFVCSCAYLSRTPRFQDALFSRKRGPLGILWKAAVLGTRLHAWFAAACAIAGFWVLFFA